MPPSGDEVRVPESGTEVSIEAATDGRIYVTIVDAAAAGCELILSPREADLLAENLADKARCVREWRATN